MDYGKRREWYLPLWEKHYLSRKNTLTIKIHEHLKGSAEKREGRSEWIYEELDVGKWDERGDPQLFKKCFTVKSVYTWLQVG